MCCQRLGVRWYESYPRSKPSSVYNLEQFTSLLSGIQFSHQENRGFSFHDLHACSQLWVSVVRVQSIPFLCPQPHAPSEIYFLEMEDSLQNLMDYLLSPKGQTYKPIRHAWDARPQWQWLSASSRSHFLLTGIAPDMEIESMNSRVRPFQINRRNLSPLLYDLRQET